LAKVKWVTKVEAHCCGVVWRYQQVIISQHSSKNLDLSKFFHVFVAISFSFNPCMGQTNLKRPSHIKVMLANSCWPTHVGKLKLVCLNDKQHVVNCWQQIELVSILANFLPTVCQHAVVSFTHTNLSLPTRVGQH